MGQPVDQQRFGDRYVTVRDGLRLHVREYPGDARRPALLCLPGLTRNARDFADFAERYSPDFRVLALDYRGRGSSDYDPQPQRYTPLTYAGDVIELLDQLGLPSAVFVGTSLGGLVTMIVAGWASQRIQAAVLNDVGPELSEAGLERIRSYVGKDVRFAGWDEAAQALAENNRTLRPHYTSEDWERMARRICREEDGDVRFDYDMAIATPFGRSPAPKVDMWPMFEALARRPLLVIRGEYSDLLSADALSVMQQRAPHAVFVTIPGVGHPPDLDEPAAIEAIDRFVHSVPA